jgi:hypothetical protein
MKLLLSTCVLALVLIYALYRKGDVKAGFKTPIIEFSLDTKATPPISTPTK